MSDPDETAWQVVASASDVLASGMQDASVGRHLVLLIAHDGKVLAFQGLCPHQHARLSEGILSDGALQCPHHLARFSLADGTCSGGWQLPPLRRYAVRLEGDAVLLPDPLRALG